MSESRVKGERKSGRPLGGWGEREWQFRLKSPRKIVEIKMNNIRAEEKLLIINSEKERECGKRLLKLKFCSTVIHVYVNR